MSDGLFPELRTIAQLFAEDEVIYTVPIYQRNYAWRAQQIEQLIDDVHDALVDSKSEGYFLGNLVVTRRSGAVLDYEVVDGQQRLTTLYVLLTVLAEDGACPANDHRGKLRYESRTRATEALRRIGLETYRPGVGAANQGAAEDGGIHEGYNTIRQFINQHPGLREVADRRRFADFLRHHVTVVRASLPPNTDLNRYFEVMNTRGQQLQQVDIVKASLMSHLQDEADRACFAWVWDSCADMDTYVQMSLTRGSPGDRTKLFGNSWSWLVRDSFDQLVSIHQEMADGAADVVSCDVMSLDSALHRYATTGTDAQKEDPESVRFRSTIEFPALLLHALTVMGQDRGEDALQLDDKRLIERFNSAVDAEGPESVRWVRDFAVALLRLRNLFDAFILKRQYTASNGEDGDWSLQRLRRRESNGKPVPGYINVFSAWEQELEEEGDVDATTRELLLLQSMLRVTYTSPRAMHWITKVLSELFNEQPDQISSQRILNLLREHARDKVRAAFFIGPQPQGFDISRIVFTYVDYLLLSRRPQGDFRFTFRNSIEHFYPQSPDREQTGAEVSPECLNLFGNLALVSVGANSKFSNSFPGAKAENYRTTIEQQSPKLHWMATITRDERVWGDRQIRHHHDEVIQLLSDDLGGPAPADPHEPEGG